jgi:hypothetical protein
LARVGQRAERIALLCGWALAAGSLAVTVGSNRWRSCAGDPLATSAKVVLGELAGSVLALLVGGIIASAREHRTRTSVAASALLWLLTAGAVAGSAWIAVNHAYDPCIGG